MDTIQFQIIDINSDDISLDESNKYNKSFVITIYGKTHDHKNIVCNVINFKPYFFIRIPGSWTAGSVESFLKVVSSYMKGKSNSWSVWSGMYNKVETETSYNFFGYNYDPDCEKKKLYRFGKISFESYGDMRKCISAITNFHKDKKKDFKQEDYIKQWFHQSHNCHCVANLYESKLHPTLRFIHETNIQSCGWIQVSYKSLVEVEDHIFNVDIQIDNVEPKHITSCNIEKTAQFITASFDIECDSSHGDFPNPIKDFKELAIDIYESYFRYSVNKGITSKIKKDYIRKWILEAFDKGSNDIRILYTQNDKCSEESLEKVLQYMDDKFMKLLDESNESSSLRDPMIKELTKLFNQFKNDKKEHILIKGDPIIQIGTVFHKYGDSDVYDRSIIVIGNDESTPIDEICDDIEGINVYRCQTEKELLLKWKDLILFHNPDLITGYNIFGFDFEYISKRVDHLFPCNEQCKKNKTYLNCSQKCCKHDFYRLGRLMRNPDSDVITDLRKTNPCKTTSGTYKQYWEKRCVMTSKELSSSGLGDNILKYITMDGRIIFDVQKEIQKGHALESYKLDNVSSHFMKGTIKEKRKFTIKDENNQRLFRESLITSKIGNLKVGDYITILLTTKYGNLKYNDNEKFKIIQIIHNKLNKDYTIRINGSIHLKQYKCDLLSYEWCLAKDDVSPQQIFEYHKTGGSRGRALIAKYCIMDCELCIHLLSLLDIIPNNIGMANVSHVPLSYIFLRGQGIKISSLVTKQCTSKNTKIPTLLIDNSDESKEGFEGAIVLEPTPGIYYEDPISVLDFASLYPQSIREKNMSHETFIATKEDIDANPSNYTWMKHIDVNEISYDDYIYETRGKTTHKLKADTQTTCYFASQKKNQSKGIIPLILETLLDQRKKTRKLIKMTDDVAKQKVLDGLQLAYKVTANSVYGQMGARTSSIFFKKIAACTTSIGRQRIYDAKEGVVQWAEENNYHKPEVVYGDTDSVFVKFSRRHHETNELLTGKEALQYCIDCGIKAGEWITKEKLNIGLENGPQDLEYEKTFYPFILISKKRYTGDKYEYTSDKPKERTSMGIVMKRRDNAPLVKYVFGNVIERIMNLKDIDISIEWLEKTLQKIIDGKMDTSMFIISKSLSGYYKNPKGIAHKVLADRMADRNPGNKPKPNDRIPYIYIPVEEYELSGKFQMTTKRVQNGVYKNGKPKYKTVKEKGKEKLKKKKVLQGDRIEHPDFIKENKLNIDYKFYISNQIMNPVKQVLDLVKSEEETTKFFQRFIQ